MAALGADDFKREPGGAEPFSAGAVTAIRDETKRVLDSPEFVVPDRARRFLSYIVEEALDGRADRIKAFSIATDVLGRDSSFDGSVDPVVRIEAGRVRRALEHYYLTAGADDDLVLTIPKGGYVPTFTWRDRLPPCNAEGGESERCLSSRQNWRRPPWPAVLGAAAAAAGCIAILTGNPVTSALRTSENRPTPLSFRVLMTPFAEAPDTPETVVVARGLTDEVVRQLAGFREIEVVVEPSPAARDSEQRPSYELQGSIRSDKTRFRLSARLINCSNGVVVWAENYDAALDLSKLLETEVTMAGKVAAALAPTFGHRLSQRYH